MIEQLTKIADTVFRNLLPISAKESGIFRLLMTVDIDGAAKPLLIVGNAHSQIEDGDCIAVLNPDHDLLSELHGGVAYMAGLKEIVSGRCDAMVHLWIEAYGSNETSVLYKYLSRSPSAAKFRVGVDERLVARNAL